MSTFEDRLVGEKLQYYVSSSESEDDEQKNAPSTTSSTTSAPPQKSTIKTHKSGISTNTGPKGVVQDWQLFKKLEAEKREDSEKFRVELANKLSKTVGSHKDEEKRKENEEIDKELDELMNDEILLEFQRKRMQEMLKAAGNYKEFGNVFNLNTSAEFLDIIEKENKHVVIIIHVYANNVYACKTINNCFEIMAREHRTVKFCKVLCTVTNMSKNFYDNALPALLVYKGGTLIGNFIQIVKELGEDFTPSDLEGFLIEKGMLIEKLNLYA